MADKICLVGGGLQGGGQERAIVNLANYLVNKGWSVSIISLFKTEQFYPTDDRIIIEWPNIIRSKHHRLIYALKMLPYIRRTIKESKPDVILSFGEWFNPFVLLSTRFLDVPVYLSDRMGPLMKLDPIIQVSRRLTYRHADGVIVQTKIAAEIVKKLTNSNNIRIIPNPLNPINCEVSNKVKRIITIGRLSKEKGHIHLIRAFNKIKYNDWSLSIIGDGPEKEFLQNETERLKINNRIHFHGHLKDFSVLLGESEIFVLPSLHEGFPNALLEAMSVPLACISSNCIAGPADIIKHGINGLLVKPGDENDLKEAIIKLIENPELRKSLAEEAYKVRDRYNYEKIADEYVKFIQG